MLPTEIGERAEAAVLAALACFGKRLLLPFGEQHRFDLAYEESGRLVKVQCKSGVARKGAIRFRTHTVCRSSLRDYRNDIDFFGVYCHDRREVYLVPVGDVPPRGAHLRVEPPQNNQRAKIRAADEYLIWAEGRPVGNTLTAPALKHPSRPGQLILTNIDIGAKLGDMELPVA